MSDKVEQQYEEIMAVLEKHPEGLYRGEISNLLSISINNKTLQRRLTKLARDGKVTIQGIKRGTTYHPAPPESGMVETELKDRKSTIFSNLSKDALKLLDEPVHSREKMSYNRDFLEIGRAHV